MYLKYDGGRRMPDYMIDNIINLSTDFNTFIKQHCTGKDGVSMGRPFRYAINTYSLKHTKTIEFRFFRASVDKNEMHDMFLFVENFNPRQWKSYLATKYDKSRGVKKRDGFVSI